MKRKLIIFFFAMIWVQALVAQEARPLNSIIVETNVIGTAHLSYDRIIPWTERVSLAAGAEYWLGIGFGWGAHWIVPNFKALFFGPKHFLELGGLFAFDISGQEDKESENWDPDQGPGVKLAYRYQTKGGFIIRASANFVYGIDPPVVPAVGIGFAF